MQDRKRQIVETLLRRTAGPYIWVSQYRPGQPNIAVRLRSPSKTGHEFEALTRTASLRHRLFHKQ